ARAAGAVAPVRLLQHRPRQRHRARGPGREAAPHRRDRDRGLGLPVGAPSASPIPVRVPSSSSSSSPSSPRCRNLRFPMSTATPPLTAAPSIDPAVPLRQRILAAARAALGDEAADVDPALHLSQHADYQADLALALARKLGRKPRDLAAAIATALPADDVIAEVAVSGPGFINVTLRPGFLAGVVERMRADPSGRLGVPPVAEPIRV